MTHSGQTRRELLRSGFAVLAGGTLASACPARGSAQSSTPAARTVKAAYLSYYGVGDRAIRGHVLELLDRTELNAVVIDVKGDRGLIPYESDLALRA